MGTIKDARRFSGKLIVNITIDKYLMQKVVFMRIH